MIELQRLVLDFRTGELAHVLFSLGYVEDLADEREIAAAVEVARGDYPQWSPTA